MSSNLKFVTGSSYQGVYSKSAHMMKDFGLYTYPDGSEYRGYFKSGKFHGYGRLKLAAPNKFSLKGIFNNGSLEKIHEMTFCDGLRLNGTFNGYELDLPNWSYCSQGDRRFSTEISNGIAAVGRHAYETRKRPARCIEPDLYDTEEGIFNANNGVLIIMRKIIPSFRYVSCKSEIDWICQNCRIGRRQDDVFHEPDVETCKRIIQTNIKQMNDTSANEHCLTCVCCTEKLTKNRLDKLCNSEQVNQKCNLLQSSKVENRDDISQCSVTSSISDSSTLTIDSVKEFHLYPAQGAQQMSERSSDDDESDLMEQHNSSVYFTMQT